MDPDLSALTATMAMQLLARSADADPPWGATITMQAATFGNSRVNQAGRDVHVTTGE